ncbi:MAG TPA: DNA adenine methylase, partial [Rectinemataceae bacterium]|nr:DNA adenine methylase [Rectinemataceae bacterium]
MSPESGAGTSEDLLYASRSLIAYIGSKRALLPFLRTVFLELHDRRPLLRFLDPFAGTGAVSRLARTLGLKVMANDSEPYSWAVNACWLSIPAEDGPRLFGEEGGVAGVLERLNALHPARLGHAAPEDSHPPYIARFYAPAETSRGDWRKERLFYTRENALFLDRVRYAIDELRPPTGQFLGTAPKLDRVEQERAVLLGPLVHQAATHVNTSGVFKAFHKGYGGHGRDALGRIMSPMSLDPPLLWPGPAAELGCGDAAAFCAGRSADLCYLD